MSLVKLFAFPEARALAYRTAALLGVALANSEMEEFPDGEGRLRSDEAVDGSDVVVFAALDGRARSPAEKLCLLAFFVHSLRDLGARSVTVVAPYLAYARSDRRVVPFDPLCLKATATMLESVGMSRILVIDAHNPAAFENAFRYAVAETLEAFSLFSGPLSTELEKNTPLVVLAPDLGGVKRAESFRKALSRELQREIGFAFLEKHRRHEFVGLKGGAELEESEVLIIDDMISTGETILRALEACRRGGAKCASVMATHGQIGRAYV